MAGVNVDRAKQIVRERVWALLEEAHVATVGGDSFGDPKSIRISYAASEEKLIEAMNRIKTALAKLS